MRRRVLDWLRHRLNPVHCYCRLMDCGFSKGNAMRLSAAWEKWVFRRPGLACVAVIVGTILVSCAVAQAKHDHPEHWYQAIWCAEHQGEMETVPREGLRVDCETSTHAIEFDFANKWAESVGQALAYAMATGKKAGVVLILERPGDVRFLDKFKLAVSGAGLPVDLWVMGAGVPEEAGHGR